MEPTELVLDGQSCAEILDVASCDASIRNFNKNAPPGSLVQDGCPISCGICQPNVDSTTGAPSISEMKTTNAESSTIGRLLFETLK